MVDLRSNRISPRTVGMRLDQDERRGSIGEPAVRDAVAVFVERDRVESPVPIGLPFVRFSIAFRILFRTDEDSLSVGPSLGEIVVFPPVDLALVACRRDLDALKSIVLTRRYPG